ncbi:U3 small nucleolar RNA-associated protein 18 homolog [Ostrinia furnacalis]|uniref:U3 small nucleolar RNA-associated protein 18 homolog n=1 Tax=Ostrinia furnacalis TaxID=93504 RepID=UPI00103DAA41|nr:U3 small nucleolar RNA-associated protein 18 homolog [Ostrinia furnacalis]
MKRKLSSINDEESRLSKLLFNKSKDLVDKLKTTPSDEPKPDVDRKPVWIDEDDHQFSAKTKTENLKQKYESLMGTPNWAKLTEPKLEEGNDDDDGILRTVGHMRKSKTFNLPNKMLDMKLLPKINSETRNEGRIISCIDFHPKLSVALVSGNAGIVSLLSVGGDVNEKLHSFQLKNWKTMSAQFNPSGSEAFLATELNHSYCVYDLVKAEPKLVQLPRIVKRPKLFKLSPDGKYIATSTGFDEIYLISTSSKELLRTLKHNSNVESLTFSHDSEQLYCYCKQGEITIWDLSTFRALKKFYDNGCVNASCLAVSPCGKLLATGSQEGIVNIYDTTKLETYEPLPLKTISNLTTKISCLKFNATTEILSASSNVIPDAVKLIHIPSYHVFVNFPPHTKVLSKVQTINFSPNSGYMALGNNKGYANLYRLKYYKNY